MATVVQQQQPIEMSAARAFWNGKMQEHPNLAGGLAIAQEIAGFFLNGHCIVALARWIIRVSGYVAESALLFAVLWISGTSVAPGLIELVMSDKTMQYFVSVALIALALIPEVILANAIVNALGHWHRVMRDRENSVAWIWAVLLTIPALLFLVLTSITLGRLTANGGNFIQASSDILGFRCFAGWTYGLLELVYAGVGKRMIAASVPAQPVPQPAIQIDYQEVARHLLPVITHQVTQLRTDLTTQWTTEMQTLHTQVEDVAAFVLTQSAMGSDQQSGQEEDSEETPIVNSAEYRSGHPVDNDVSTPAHFEETKVSPLLSTQETPIRESVYTQPSPKTTVRLSTGVSTKTSTGDAQKRAARVLKKYPAIGPTELAQKAQISRSYASKILAEQKG